MHFLHTLLSITNLSTLLSVNCYCITVPTKGGGFEHRLDNEIKEFWEIFLKFHNYTHEFYV